MGVEPDQRQRQQALLRKNPELLTELMLGADHAGPGLITRVAERVRELGYEPGPGFRSGSITGQVDHHHEDSEDEQRVFKLYLAVRYILGQGHDPEGEREYLRQHRLTDVDALLRQGRGLLGQLRSLVSLYLKSPSEARVERVGHIAEVLMDWLGNRCSHTLMVPMGGDGSVTVLVCLCGIRIHEDKRGNWLAI